MFKYKNLSLIILSNISGIFVFRFWSCGKWVEVVVDDKLLVNVNNLLDFCRNKKQPNEFWLPLLEKAYTQSEYNKYSIERVFFILFTGFMVPKL